jgi:hypothetical protein
MKIYQQIPLILALSSALIGTGAAQRDLASTKANTTILISPRVNVSLSITPPKPPPTRQHLPRLVLYAQTFYEDANYLKSVSLLPLIHNPAVTHVNIAAFHLNGPGLINLNDFPPSDSRYNTLWKQVKKLKKAGIKVMAMLGGAAKGSYWRLPSNNMTTVCTPMRENTKINSLTAPVRSSLSTFEDNL